MSRNKAAKNLEQLQSFGKDVLTRKKLQNLSPEWGQMVHKAKKRAGSGGHLRRKGKS